MELSTFKKHQEKINSYNALINLHNYEEMMSNIYNYVKSISPLYYEDGKLNPYYTDYLFHHLLLAECNMVSKNPLFDIHIPFSMIDKESSNYIEDLVFFARKKLIEKTKKRTYSEYNLEDFNFADSCCDASYIIYEQCHKNNIKCREITIHPGYCANNVIDNDLLLHRFNIIRYAGKYYLIDITYSQFFSKQKNNLDRLGVLYTNGSFVGSYMMLNNDTMNIAKTIIEKGYIEITENNFKTYMDGFTLSFRNGLYYETNGITTFKTDYSVDDYIRFLKFEDNQVIKEGKDNLGLQMKPLSNPKIDFRAFSK